MPHILLPYQRQRGRRPEAQALVLDCDQEGLSLRTVGDFSDIARWESRILRECDITRKLNRALKVPGATIPSAWAAVHAELKEMERDTAVELLLAGYEGEVSHAD
tara:strand:- start:2093 stop:2407 length:315 start_codon:yes stop_codon:yes gene_type:complete